MLKPRLNRAPLFWFALSVCATTATANQITNAVSSDPADTNLTIANLGSPSDPFTVSTLFYGMNFPNTTPITLSITTDGAAEYLTFQSAEIANLSGTPWTSFGVELISSPPGSTLGTISRDSSEFSVGNFVTSTSFILYGGTPSNVSLNTYIEISAAGTFVLQFTPNAPVPTPEPSSLVLGLLAAAGLGAWSCCRGKRSA